MMLLLIIVSLYLTPSHGETSLDWNGHQLISQHEFSALNRKINDIRAFFHPIPGQNGLTLRREAIEALPLSSPCKLYLNEYVNAKVQSSNWTYQIEDASGKPMAGMMSGNLEFFGDFDECINVRVGTESDPWLDSDERDSQVFRGRYCTLGIKVETNLSSDSYKALTGFKVEKLARLGLCSLSACSKSDIVSIASNLLQESQTQVKVLACDGYDERQHQTTPRAVKYILWTLIALLFSGTLLDLVTKGIYPGQSLCMEVIMAFSVPRNLRSILWEDQTPRKSRFINVFKGISMILVFHGHSHMIIRFVSLDSISKHYDMLTKPLYQMFIIAGFLSVDLFLFISAVISVKVVLPKFRQLLEVETTFRGIIGKVLLILTHRYVRLMPSLIFLMAVHVWSENLMLGPLWMEYSEKWLHPCRTQWLPNILLVNNLLPWNPEDPNCAFHSWHLGLDMQLFIFGLLFFIILGAQHPKTAITINLALLSTTIIAKGVLTGYYGYPPMVLSGNRNRENLYFSQVYTKPWFRADPYLLGLLFGYFCTQGHTLNITKRTKSAINLLVIISISIILIAPASYHTAETYSTIGITLYAALHRTVWSLCLGWIFYCGFTNDYPILNSIADWHIWEILSNISYQFFLFHPIVFFIYFGCTSTPLGERVLLMLMAEPGGILLTMLVSMLMTLVIEWPIHNIIRIIRTRSFNNHSDAKIE